MIKVTITKSKPHSYGAYSVHETSYKFFADNDLQGIESFANANKDNELKFEKL